MYFVITNILLRNLSCLFVFMIWSFFFLYKRFVFISLWVGFDFFFNFRSFRNNVGMSNSRWFFGICWFKKEWNFKNIRTPANRTRLEKPSKRELKIIVFFKKLIKFIPKIWFSSHLNYRDDKHTCDNIKRCGLKCRKPQKHQLNNVP